MSDLYKTNKPQARVVEYQTNLMFLGFDLGLSGADGYPGTKTKNASFDAAAKYSLPPPGAGGDIPAALVDGVKRIADAKRARSNPKKPANFFDLTERAYTGPREKRVPIGSWTGATIHQTGCPMGLSFWSQDKIFKRWSDASYKDSKTGLIVRSSLRAHIGITRRAEVLLIHPLEWFIWHAQRQSLTNIGIEVECFARGIEDDPETLPSGGFPWLEATEEQIQAALDTLVWLDEVIRFYGGAGLEFVDPHRTADDDRRADCGQKLYRRVVLKIREILKGIKKRPRGFKTGSGLPVPELWDPDFVGIKY